MNHQRPAFLITIDTEGDNLWDAAAPLTTHNARFLPRFQQLCERFGLRPTWLTNYEMSQSPEYTDFAGDLLRRSAGEIGMHLHAWDSPPLTDLTGDDKKHGTYLIEYPRTVMREKIRLMTETLEGKFNRKMTSHRAGRWALNEVYVQLLIDEGYQVDCSVTPHIDWSAHKGSPTGSGGSDYTRFSQRPYYLNPQAISQTGDSSLLEVPLSVIRPPLAGLNRVVARGPRIVRRITRKCFPPLTWLRPDGKNLGPMLGILRHALRNGWPCVEMMLHSSELMPGGSPTFSSSREIERLYEHLEVLFSIASKSFDGATLSEFGRRWSRARNKSKCRQAA